MKVWWYERNGELTSALDSIGDRTEKVLIGPNPIAEIVTLPTDERGAWRGMMITRGGRIEISSSDWVVTTEPVLTETSDSGEFFQVKPEAL